ncbi:MAG: phospholipase D-like domain-containing protein [Longimicrobiales bacterium]
MDRAADTRRIDGNALELQFDGPTTFESWIDAIEAAERSILFENYILRDDRIGRIFREVLIETARRGVEVRVLYDWVGCWATSRRYWKPFKEAGVEVRSFNPPTLRDPFGVFQRDHRKVVCVDGETAFVGGFCVGEEWAGLGDEAPWRDTGVGIRGPAAAAVARSFEKVWDEIGSPVPEHVRARTGGAALRGETPVWVIEGQPWRSRVYRVSQLVAASAQERIWITDPYFVAPRPVSEALMAAARDGVDVRILVPAHNNWPWVGTLSRGGYRSLLESGVRIFEWEGPMIHAKTSVADGIWCRIGSSNLNAASLLGNWEIDVGVLDQDLATQLEGLFLADLASSREILLPGSVPLPVRPSRERFGLPADPGDGASPEERRSTSAGTDPGATAEPVEAGAADPGGEEREGGGQEAALESSREPAGERGGLAGEPDPGRGPAAREEESGASPRPATVLRSPDTLSERLEEIRRSKAYGTWHLADLVRAGSAFGDAIAGHRVLGREDRTVLGTVAVLVLFIAVASGFFPSLVGWIVAVISGWFGIVLGARAIYQAREARREERAERREERSRRDPAVVPGKDQRDGSRGSARRSPGPRDADGPEG